MKKTFAKILRKNATDVENILWGRLRNRQILGYKFRRQEPMEKYIVDFLCVQRKLIIELDGSQHFDNLNYDEERTQFLNQLGYKVIRFWNNEILINLDEVLESIVNYLE